MTRVLSFCFVIVLMGFFVMNWMALEQRQRQEKEEKQQVQLLQKKLQEEKRKAIKARLLEWRRVRIMIKESTVQDPKFVTLLMDIERTCNAKYQAVQKAKQMESAVLMGIAAVFLGPMILGWGTGLHGAAAISSGLATLGGGSLLAGGLGMKGGLTVLALTGSLIGASIADQEFLLPCIHQETVTLGQQRFSSFTYQSQAGIVEYDGELVFPDQIFFRGRIRDGKALFGSVYRRSLNQKDDLLGEISNE